MALPNRFLVFLLTLMLAGCGSISIQDYAANRPTLVPESFFNGQLSAHGVVKNRSGKVIRYFNADIKAYWKDGVGTLEEDFLFDDGEKDRRVWTLTPSGNGSYIGTAGDVVGDGEVQFAGNTMFLDYVLRIPYNDGTLDIRIDDRMYLVNPTTLMNESRMTKFGVDVGEILLVIRKL